MSKLVAISKEQLADLGESLSVRFGANIQPDGNYTYVIIEKGGRNIALTPEQAKSLAEQIKGRIA